jgi:S1-C subfamily serine protease
MFKAALKTAGLFTFPYVGLRRRHNGQVYSNIGAFVVLNRDGWALTSAHLVNEILAVEREAQADLATMPAEQPAPSPVRDHAEIWAVPGFAETRPQLAQAIVRPVADAALVRLEPFDQGCVVNYPVLRDPDACPVEQGMSVCRLGYPFHDISATWDAGKHEFQLPPAAFPVPSFALDGIVARFRRVSADDGPHDATYIETSTPGLRGQSGGPLIDTEGRVCGIQSHTTHLDLGFDARFSAGERVVAERQFLNVGAATHIAELISMLDEAGIEYDLG